MMKKYLLTFTALLTASVSYALDCATPPSCEDLGYTKSAADCTTSLKCPFDTSKVFCVGGTNAELCIEEGYTATSCLSGQTKTSCSYDSSYVKCSGCPTGYYVLTDETLCDCANGTFNNGLYTSTTGAACYRCYLTGDDTLGSGKIPTVCSDFSLEVTATCPTGYYLAEADELCSCVYGQYSDGTKADDGTTTCYRCGTSSECSTSAGLVACLKCNTSVEDTTTGSCSGGAQGSSCACGGTHTSLGSTAAHACAL